MNTDTAQHHFTPDTRPPMLSAVEIRTAQEWMISKGYRAHDPKAHRDLARFLVHRKRKQVSRGLALVGPHGNGKTLWLRQFSHVKVYTAKELVEIFKEDRKTFYEIIQPPNYDDMSKAKGYFDLAIDDVGFERKTVNFGEKADVIEEALAVRYDVFMRWGGLTYITSNLKTEREVIRLYGTRIESRWHQMFATIRFTGSDQRKATTGETQ